MNSFTWWDNVSLASSAYPAIIHSSGSGGAPPFLWKCYPFPITLSLCCWDAGADYILSSLCWPFFKKFLIVFFPLPLAPSPLQAHTVVHFHESFLCWPVTKAHFSEGSCILPFPSPPPASIATWLVWGWHSTESDQLWASPTPFA